MINLDVENRMDQNLIYIHFNICYMQNTEIIKMSKVYIMSSRSDSLLNLNMAIISQALLSTRYIAKCFINTTSAALPCIHIPIVQKNKPRGRDVERCPGTLLVSGRTRI